MKSQLILSWKLTFFKMTEKKKKSLEEEMLNSSSWGVGEPGLAGSPCAASEAGVMVVVPLHL
jgi:hypothetical protein